MSEQAMSDELPALPEPEVHDAAGYRRAFTADQMRDYARQASVATAEKMREANHNLFNALQDAKAALAEPAVAPFAWLTIGDARGKPMLSAATLDEPDETRRALAEADRQQIVPVYRAAPAVAQEPFGWAWKDKRNGSHGLYLEDPRKFDIDLGDDNYEWTVVYAAPAAAPQDATAWMDPTTRDVISAARKLSWETQFGAGGASRASTYTVPLYTAAPQDGKVAHPSKNAVEHVIRRLEMSAADPMNPMDAAGPVLLRNAAMYLRDHPALKGE